MKPTEREIERRNRIKWAVAAYAYQIADDPVMTDEQFDRLARKIRPQVTTGNILCDVYFRLHFSPDTAMMITRHPEISGIAHIYRVMGDLIRDYHIEGWRPDK